jgi:hypothetical protein
MAEGTLEITISNQSTATSVPDTNSFSLMDVIDVVQPSGGNSLSDCFNEATGASFDADYEGSKNSLLNFRNYNG